MIANGGIQEYTDILECFKTTEADAVMIGERLMVYPAFCASNTITSVQLLREYMHLANTVDTHKGYILQHCHNFLRDTFARGNGDLRELLNEQGVSSIEKVLNELERRYSDVQISSN